MRRVLIGTPSHDGKVDVWYCNSLVRTIKMAVQKGIYIQPVYTSYDSLVQRARNSLVKIAIDQGFDDLFFIDSDQEWEPEWIFQLLDRPEPFVGLPVIKKSDRETYNVKLLSTDLKYSRDGELIEVDGIGTGFLKISRMAFLKLWEISPEYTNEDQKEKEINKMVFDVQVKDGILISEDIVICNKWKGLGYKVWINPKMTCKHIGPKKFEGNFNSYLQKFISKKE